MVVLPWLVKVVSYSNLPHLKGCSSGMSTISNSSCSKNDHLAQCKATNAEYNRLTQCKLLQKLQAYTCISRLCSIVTVTIIRNTAILGTVKKALTTEQIDRCMPFNVMTLL